MICVRPRLEGGEPHAVSEKHHNPFTSTSPWGGGKHALQHTTQRGGERALQHTRHSSPCQPLTPTSGGTPIFLHLPITTVPSTGQMVVTNAQARSDGFSGSSSSKRRCARWAACFIACLSCYYAAHWARHATSAGADVALVRLLARPAYLHQVIRVRLNKARLPQRTPEATSQTRASERAQHCVTLAGAQEPVHSCGECFYADTAKFHARRFGFLCVAPQEKGRGGRQKRKRKGRAKALDRVDGAEGRECVLGQDVKGACAQGSTSDHCERPQETSRGTRSACSSPAYSFGHRAGGESSYSPKMPFGCPYGTSSCATSIALRPDLARRR